MNIKKGFTLIELLMVIAILGMVATLAVNKIGGIREASARKVSLANQIAIGRAVEAYLVANPTRGINRLDSLLDFDAWNSVYDGDGNGFMTAYKMQSVDYPHFYKGAQRNGSVDYSETNSGLTPNLIKNVLLPYSLSAKEATVLNSHGFKLVMSHWTDATTSPFNERSADNAFPPDDSTIALKPHESACIAVTNQYRSVVAAVNPFSTEGREIYRECGQPLLNLHTNRTEYVEGEVLEEVRSTGGALLVFGLGADASIIGASDGGLETVPYATYPLARYYRQYLLLFRIDTTTNKGNMVFAGVLDPCGFSVKQARSAIKNL